LTSIRNIFTLSGLEKTTSHARLPLITSPVPVAFLYSLISFNDMRWHPMWLAFR
jgi:hypothetical protein